MQWPPNFLTRLGTSGACANAARSLAEDRAVAAELERFLARYHHPAGWGLAPVEPSVDPCTRVA